MIDFKQWGVMTRHIPECNYRAAWSDLTTLRVGRGNPQALPPEWSEFYDVSLGRRCNGACPFCYTNAQHNGVLYENVTKKVETLISTIWADSDHRPFQVALGSEGEPTIHPEFDTVCREFYNGRIVPNYTTNGLTLVNKDTRDSILRTTAEYVGGVAVSVYNWNPWKDAVRNLFKHGNTNVNLHIILSDPGSVGRLAEIYDWGGDMIHTYVLLPLMPEGRSKEMMMDETFHCLQVFLKDKPNNQFALGAMMYPWLTEKQDPFLPQIKVSMYEPETYSKNLILDDPIRITPSSFNTRDTLCSLNIL